MNENMSLREKITLITLVENQPELWQNGLCRYSHENELVWRGIGEQLNPPQRGTILYLIEMFIVSTFFTFTRIFDMVQMQVAARGAARA